MCKHLRIQFPLTLPSVSSLFFSLVQITKVFWKWAVATRIILKTLTLNAVQKICCWCKFNLHYWSVNARTYNRKGGLCRQGIQWRVGSVLWTTFFYFSFLGKKLLGFNRKCIFLSSMKLFIISQALVPASFWNPYTRVKKCNTSALARRQMVVYYCKVHSHRFGIV